ncbi:MAG: DUF6089 family protein [Mariniphaga sp.]
MRKLAFIIILILSGFYAYSQQTADIGIQVAAATYWGDIENVNFSKSITPVVGVLGRWNFNKRLAVRGQLFTGNLKAEGLFSNSNLAQSGERINPEEYPLDLTQFYNFNRSFQSVEALFEFNFRNYKLGSTSKEMFTPFVSVGLGAFYSRASRVGTFILMPFETFPGSGVYQPYLNDNLDKTNNSDALSLTIPVGVGVKFNITKRLGGIIELIVRKTFTDNIDNLDDPKRFQFDAATISPLFEYPAKVSNFQLNNNDYYATLALSICYQLWSSKGNCAIYDKIKK